MKITNKQIDKIAGGKFKGYIYWRIFFILILILVIVGFVIMVFKI